VHGKRQGRNKRQRRLGNRGDKGTRVSGARKGDKAMRVGKAARGGKVTRVGKGDKRLTKKRTFLHVGGSLAR
jgi:hypothetical protein